MAVATLGSATVATPAGSGTSLTFAHTQDAGTDPALVVCVLSRESSTTSSITSVKYDDDLLTIGVQVTDTSDADGLIAGVAVDGDPTTGSSVNVVVTMAATVTHIEAVAQGVSGASGSVGQTKTQTSSTAFATTTLDSIDDTGSMIFDAGTSYSGGAISADAAQTELLNANGNAGGKRVVASHELGTGDGAMTWTGSPNRLRTHVVAEVLPAAAGGVHVHANPLRGPLGHAVGGPV